MLIYVCLLGHIICPYQYVCFTLNDKVMLIDFITKQPVRTAYASEHICNNEREVTNCVEFSYYIDIIRTKRVRSQTQSSGTATNMVADTRVYHGT